MSNFQIKASAHYLPPLVRSNDYYANYLDTSDAWISKRTGIKSRHINEGTIAMMLEALITKSKFAQLDLSQVSTVIVATCSNLEIMPNLASRVHHLLPLNKNVLCLDINTACSGFVSSLITASKLLQTAGEQILVIGIDQMSSIVDQNDRNTCILFGDGAGMMLLEANQRQQQLASYSTCEYNEQALQTSNSHIIMQGQEVFKYAVKTVIEHIDHLLLEANLKISDLSYLVCHQANERILKAIRRHFNLDEHQVLSTIAWSANTSSASIPICFDYYRDLFTNNDKIIMIGFGAGLITSSLLYEM